jgi:hypothetical protein
MSRFPLTLALCIAAATPALGLETGTIDLRYGSLSGDPGTFSAARLIGETALTFGPWGLQFGATLAQLTDADQNTARAVLFRNEGAHFRIGASVATASFDGVETAGTDFGLHFLWTAPGARIDAALVVPLHVVDTGSFSYDISGLQRLTPTIAVTTDLYRLSTDQELDDFWSIALGLRYDASDRMVLTAAGSRSTADDYNFDNRMARLGLDWRMADATTVSAALLHLVTEDDGTQTGVELRLRRDFGPAADHARLFDTGPLPDRFAIGAFEP